MGFSRNNATNEATTEQKQAANQGPKQSAPNNLNQAGSSLNHDVAHPQDNRADHRKKSRKACDAIIARILK